MKRKLLLSLIFGLIIGVSIGAQSRGTPSQLRVRVDANGALLASAVAAVSPITSCTFNNCRLATDSNGNLITTVSGSIPTPTFTLPITFDGTVDYTFSNTAPTPDYPPTAVNELRISNSLGSAGVLALQNTSTSGYSAFTARSSDGYEYFAMGYGNASTNPTVFNDINYIESWTGVSTAASPKRLAIMMDGNYGSLGSNQRFYIRQSFEPDGSITWWQHIPSTMTQVESMHLLKDGGLSLGLATPGAMLHIRNQNSLRGGIFAENISSTAPQSAVFSGYRARGTVGALTKVLTNDTLVSFTAAGYQESTGAYGSLTGRLDFFATEDFTSTAQGTSFQLRTTPNGSTTSIAAIQVGAVVNSLILTTVVAPASSGTRYLCISTAGVISSSASACSGT